MKAGQLKDKINILYPTTTKSIYGEQKTVWYVKYQTRANVRYVSSNRTNEQNEILFANTLEFKVRKYVPLEDNYRVEFKNKQYRIISILPNDNTQDITIITELIND